MPGSERDEDGFGGGGGVACGVADADGKTVTEAPLRREGEHWALDCAPGMEKYRVRPSGG